MSYVDLDDYRFNNIIPLARWQPMPEPALFAFFIINNPPDVWDTEGPSVEYPIVLLTPHDFEQSSFCRSWESWQQRWLRDLLPGESIAVGTHPMPGASWLHIQCTASDIMMRHVVELCAS
jgi:hypothetical protein